ncbi:MAG: ATP-binding protein [Clostridiaceae bacterium]|jgi:hypothetical protein|nr:ATP-binding protein [Clostridiaceae bacterium]
MRELAEHLMDLVQNARRARARHIEMSITALPESDQLILKVQDDGSGIRPDLLAKVTDPYATSRTTRPVGLGLPLLKEQCEQTGGHMKIRSLAQMGTTVEAVLGLRHIDRLPLGDIGGTMVLLVMDDPDQEYRLVLKSPRGCLDLATADLRRQLQEVPLHDMAVLDWLAAYVKEQQETIFGGVLDEIIS